MGSGAWGMWRVCCDDRMWTVERQCFEEINRNLHTRNPQKVDPSRRTRPVALPSRVPTPKWGRGNGLPPPRRYSRRPLCATYGLRGLSEEADESAPHPFGIGEADSQSDLFDGLSSIFDAQSCRFCPQPFYRLGRWHPGFLSK